LFQIDKSGSDIFEKDYSIVIVVDKKEVYGVNVPQKIKDDLVSKFRKGELNINNKSDKKRKNRFRIRFHTSVIIKVIEKVIYDLGSIDEINIELCNDIDGHFHEIKDMLFKHFIKLIPLILSARTPAAVSVETLRPSQTNPFSCLSFLYISSRLGL